MRTSKKLALFILALCVAVWLGGISEAAALGRAFTYQGRLIDAGETADGLYDFEFELYDAEAEGSQVGGTIDADELDVIDGYFTVELDFDNASAFGGDVIYATTNGIGAGVHAQISSTGPGVFGENLGNGIDAVGMDYSKLTPILVEAVKALKIEVDEVQRQNAEKDGVIDTLKQQNDKLEDRLAALESSIATIAVQLDDH